MISLAASSHAVSVERKATTIASSVYLGRTGEMSWLVARMAAGQELAIYTQSVDDPGQSLTKSLSHILGTDCGRRPWALPSSRIARLSYRT